MAKTRFSFYLREFSGSLGDLPLFFIFFVGLTQFSGLNPLNILFWSGLAHIVVGLVFKVPLSYQPMKAMGLYAIAHSVTQPELLTAGFTIGVVILVLAAFGLFQKLYDIFPRGVIRGIQLGLAVMLLLKAMDLGFSGMNQPLTIEVIGLLFVVILILFLKRFHHLFILGVFGLTLAYLFSTNALSLPTPTFSISFLKIHFHNFAWTDTVLTLILIQIPLTTANSIFSPTLLLKDYFPEKKISASQVAFSVSMINLLTCPFGGMPACHGAGGLAAQYRFGARTGLSVVMLGVMKIICALCLGGFLITLAQAFPKGLLAILFLFPAYDLISRVLQERGVVNVVTIVVTALLYVFWHAGWALVIGWGLYVILVKLQGRKAV